MIIDTHGHLIPPDLLVTIHKETVRMPALRVIEEGGGLALAFGNAKPSRPIMKGLSDIAGRLAWMDKQGIDRQVVGGWPDWFGNDLPPAEGEMWCELINDALLSASRSQPRFVPLAALPMQDGSRRDGFGISRCDDIDAAARHRQRVGRPRYRTVLEGRGRHRGGDPHSSGLRRRRKSRQ
jgi:hypothetical protein